MKRSLTTFLMIGLLASALAQAPAPLPADNAAAPFAASPDAASPEAASPEAASPDAASPAAEMDMTAIEDAVRAALESTSADAETTIRGTYVALVTVLAIRGDTLVPAAELVRQIVDEESTAAAPEAAAPDAAAPDAAAPDAAAPDAASPDAAADILAPAPGPSVMNPAPVSGRRLLLATTLA